VDKKFNTNKLYALASGSEPFEFTLPLKDSISIDGKEYSVLLEYDGLSGAYMIVFNGKTYPVEVIKKQQNKYEIVFNNISHTINVETPFSLGRIKTLESSKKKTDQAYLKAPMPGKIISIMTNEGTKIQRGETILILEAMKMENEILSPINGTISKIHVKANTTVMKDDIMVEIKPD